MQEREKEGEKGRAGSGLVRRERKKKIRELVVNEREDVGERESKWREKFLFRAMK